MLQTDQNSYYAMLSSKSLCHICHICALVNLEREGVDILAEMATDGIRIVVK